MPEEITNTKTSTSTGTLPAPVVGDVDTTPEAPSGTDLGALSTQVKAEGGTPSFQARPGERNTDLEATNRAKLLASGELIAGGNEQLMAEKVNLATYGVENPTFGATVSSDPARTEFADTTGALKDDMTTTRAQLDNNLQFGELDLPEFQLLQDFRGEFETKRKEDKDIFERTVENIKLDFEVREKEQRDVNRTTAGQQSKNLARMGALGRTGSGLSFMKSVEVQNQTQLNKLMQQKGSVLIAAAEAASKRDLETLTKLVGHAKDLTEQFNDVQTWMFEDQMKANDQIMEQNRFGWDAEDRAMGKIAQFISSEFDVSDEEKRTLEEKAGMPEGSWDTLAEINRKAAEADAEQSELMKDLEFAKDLADILKDVPAGRSVMINGVTYTGFKTGKGWTKTTKTDGEGNVTGLAFNNDDGTWADPVDLGKVDVKSGATTWEDGDGNLWEVTGDNATPIVKDSADKQFLNPRQLPGIDEYLKGLGGTVTAEFDDFFDGRSHTGLDIDIGAIGDELVAYEGGTINKIQRVDNGGYGVYIEVLGDDGKLYRYGHMNPGSIPADWIAGDTRIESGGAIGEMGATGQVVMAPGGDGGHLHFEVMIPKNGEQFNTGAGDDLSDEEVVFQKDQKSKIDDIQAGKTTIADAKAFFRATYQTPEHVLDAMFGGITDSVVSDQFLGVDYINLTFTQDQLVAQAKESGLLGENDDTSFYVLKVNEKIQAFRDLGMTDSEIEDRMFPEE